MTDERQTPAPPDPPTVRSRRAADRRRRVGRPARRAAGTDRRARHRGAGRGTRPAGGSLAAFVVVFAAFPLFTSSGYVLRVATDTTIYALLALGLNVSSAGRGLLDLGLRRLSTASPRTCSHASSSQFGIHWPTWASVPVVLRRRRSCSGCSFAAVAEAERRLPRDRHAVLRADLPHADDAGYRLSFFGSEGRTTSPAARPGITNVDPFRFFGHQLTQVRDYLWVALGAFALVAVGASTS